MFVVVLLTFNLTANASSYSAIFVYGDSLSDNGNLFAATGFPPAPYFDLYAFPTGRLPWNSWLRNLVFRSSTSHGAAPRPDSTTKPTEAHRPCRVLFPYRGCWPNWLFTLCSPAAIPSALFVVWGGANDFETGGSPTVAVSNIDTIVGALEAEGERTSSYRGCPISADA